MFLCNQSTSHQYVSVDCYLCTLTPGCIEQGISNNLVRKEATSLTITKASTTNLMVTVKEFVTTSDALLFIQNLLLTSATGSKNNPLIISDDINSDPVTTKDIWIQCGNVTLLKRQKQDLMTGKELCDLHVNAFQNILKSQFPEIKGLQSTLVQNKTPIAKADLDFGKVLQIVHMSSHWVACQLFPNEVHFYDSAYSTVSADTLDVLAQLIRTDQSTFTVKVMSTSKQAGSVDCALYAMATLAYLAFEEDPTTVAFNQDDM